MLSTSQSLANLALSSPIASRVLRRHRLDFCCHGGRSLAEACQERGLDADTVLGEIAAAPATDVQTDFRQLPISALIDHIVTNFHEAHRRELPALVELARKVERVHAGKATVPVGLAAHLLEMHQAMELHMQKEEQVLFPMIIRGMGSRVQAPVRQMELEHDEHGEKLRQLRRICRDFVAPEEACTSWRALYLRCEQLEADLMAHIHLENHVLFPRALNLGV